MKTKNVEEELYLASEIETTEQDVFSNVSVSEETASLYCVSDSGSDCEDCESNSNTWQTAHTLILSQWMSERIVTDLDEIWFKFTTNSSVHTNGGTALYTIQTRGGVDTDGELYADPNAEPLVYKDDGGAGYNFLIQEELSYNQTYYVRVMSIGTDTGDFEICVTATAINTDSGSDSGSGSNSGSGSDCNGSGSDCDNSSGSDCNSSNSGCDCESGSANDRDTAYTLPLSTWVGGCIVNETDAVWFKFTTNSSVHTYGGTALYTIQTRGSLDTDGQLYTSTGTEAIAYDDDSGSGYNFYISEELSYGETYYVKVMSIGTYVGDFEICVDASAVNLENDSCSDCCDCCENCESNSNTMDTAYSLPLSTWVNGEIVNEQDEVWYKFTADDCTIHSQGELGWYIIQTDSHIDPIGELYNSCGILVAQDDDSNAPDFCIRAQLNYGETYYVRVTCFAGITGSFNIQVSATTFAMDTTDMSSAINLSLSTWVSGCIECPEDELLYKFTANSTTAHINGEPGWYLIETISHMDPIGELYDSFGNLIGYNDDSENGTNPDFKIQALLDYGETYYVKVSCFDTITGEFAICVIGDQSNDIETAYPITLSNSVNGTFVCADDEVWYKFTANDCTVHTEGLGWYTIKSNSYMTIGGTLYDSSGNLVASDNNSNTLDFCIRTQLDYGEQYHLKVYGYNTTIGGYEIFISGDENPFSSEDESDNNDSDLILGENYPPFFNQLASLGCLTVNDIQFTDDGFYVIAKSMADILIEKGIIAFDIAPDDPRDIIKFYDDWYIYAISLESRYTYSLLKLREQEHDVLPADGDSPGVRISFIKFDESFLIECIMNSSNDMRVALFNELNRVVSNNDETHDRDLGLYFSNHEMKAPYVIAELYVKHVARFAQNGYIHVPNEYKTQYQEFLSCKALIEKHPGLESAFFLNEYFKLSRLPNFIDENNNAAGRMVCDHDKIYIQNSNNLTPQEKYSILATHTANVSFNSFAAEVVFHAKYLKKIFKFLHKLLDPINLSIYASALHADMTIDESELTGPTPYYKLNGKSVKEQRKHHGTC